SSRRRHTRFDCDWSSDVCSSDLEFACDFHVRGDLFRERFHVFEFSLRAQILNKSHLDILPVNISMKIEQVQFDRALCLISGQGGPKTDIDETMMQHAVKPGFDKVNAVGRKLLAMRAQIRRRKTKLPTKLRSLLHCS